MKLGAIILKRFEHDYIGFHFQLEISRRRGSRGYMMKK